MYPNRKVSIRGSSRDRSQKREPSFGEAFKRVLPGKPIMSIWCMEFLVINLEAQMLLMRRRKRRSCESSLVTTRIFLRSCSTLDDTPGSVYWADWPDPKSGRSVNSRTAVSIDNERGLCSLMRSMGYKYVQTPLHSSTIAILRLQ